ncbi:MAG: M28 family peptidase [Solirubrobacteraceae bacterium]
MNRFITFVGLIVAASCQATTTPAPASGPAADVTTLASRAFLGRYPGTPGGDSAAAFIVRRYIDLHLRPAFRAGCDSAPQCGRTYVQMFPFENTVAQNVGAIVDGTDSTLRAEYIVVGAHFDHIGQSAWYSLDPQRGFVLRPGADDNASGTAGVLELARRFATRPIRRSIVVVNFDAEEEGLLGSRAFVANPPVPLRAVALMLNLDMIGRLRRGSVLVEGVAERSASRPAVDRAASTAGLRADFIADRELSDHESFVAKGIEVVSLSTGDHLDYHTVGDVASRINVHGLERVIDFAEAIVRRRDSR